MLNAAQTDRTPTNAEPPLDPDLAVWRLPTVLQHVPVSAATWWTGVRTGRFPKPIRLGPNMVGWRVRDIRALIERLSKTSAA